MPFETIHAYAFEGPNLYRPIPGIALTILSNEDRQQLLGEYIKQFAMRVGIVLGQLTISSYAFPQGLLTELHVGSPTPKLALEVAQLAAETCFGSPEQQEALEERLWQAQQRRRNEALPFWAVQILAEARQRRIPAFRWKQGLQIGYGIHGLYIPIEASANTQGILAPNAISIKGQGSEQQSQQPIDWAKLGTIPLVAISGGTPEQRQHIAEQICVAQARGYHSQSILAESSFECIRALLASPATQSAILSLSEQMVLAQGLPFERCNTTVILKPAKTPPDSYGNSEKWLRIIGLPLLVTDEAGVAILDLEDWQVELLREHAPCRISRNLEDAL